MIYNYKANSMLSRARKHSAIITHLSWICRFWLFEYEGVKSAKCSGVCAVCGICFLFLSHLISLFFLSGPPYLTVFRHQTIPGGLGARWVFGDTTFLYFLEKCSIWETLHRVRQHCWPWNVYPSTQELSHCYISALISMCDKLKIFPFYLNVWALYTFATLTKVTDYQLWKEATFIILILCALSLSCQWSVAEFTCILLTVVGSFILRLPVAPGAKKDGRQSSPGGGSAAWK